ncbi:MAG TPA: GAF domain-containing SpoIIE family protein phosphatase [Gemmatimonadaceae bacterium]|nr:GAF domain-containing SpoIIE family protein phosphatase [Gemmatimonadaceae bacterium]
MSAVKELATLLAALHDALRCGVVVWVQDRLATEPRVLAAAPRALPPPPAADLPADGTPQRLVVAGEELLVARIGGSQRAWVAVGPLQHASLDDAERLVPFVHLLVGTQLQAAVEVEQAAMELAERYEEINLLYTTSEILGRTVSLGEAAQIILTDISETVGARRAAILVHDRVTDTLQAVAALGVPPDEVPPIAADDPHSVSARVFRTQHPMLVEPDELPCEAERPYREGVMMSVPILWAAPDGGQPLGVVNLSGRRAGQLFTAGDQKLVAAIATQIGTAIQNARLVRTSLSQQRLVQEMQLAHDLQMKLLPDTAVVRPDAEVSARVVPAESVGGDFYHLFPLGPSRTGAMIGDVSSHGYRAALIMALAMSASAIHAQATDDPGEMLRALHASLQEELQSTEMFISAFYAVVDRERRELRYANTGHPHAFVIGTDGTVTRLPALDPPLGMVDDAPQAAVRPWRKGEDLLVLFTDGISDARDRRGRRLGEAPVLETVVALRDRATDEIVDRVFDVLALHTGDTPRRDDLTLVVLRS